MINVVRAFAGACFVFAAFRYVWPVPIDTAVSLASLAGLFLLIDGDHRRRRG